MKIENQGVTNERTFVINIGKIDMGIHFKEKMSRFRERIGLVLSYLIFFGLLAYPLYILGRDILRTLFHLDSLIRSYLIVLVVLGIMGLPFAFFFNRR